MSKFVVYKKGFSYSDESFDFEEGVKGSIVGIFDTLEDAKIAKGNSDNASIQNLGGMDASEFIFPNPNYGEIVENLKDYFKSEFNLSIETMEAFYFPKVIDETQANFFRETMELSFHDIVEYKDDEEINEDDFFIDDDEIGEF